MNSTFVTLSNYCVLEYMAIPFGEVNPPTLTSTFYFLDNKNVNGFQIFNTDGYETITHNSRGMSVVSQGGSKVIYDDITKVPIYSEYDPNITETQVNPTLSTNMVIDTMRFHIAAGFNFTEVENLIIGLKHKLNDLTQIQIATLLLDAETAVNVLTFNTRPLFLANTMYDRYIDIKVPSIPWLDDDFAQFGPQSFEYAITKGVGFIKGAPLTPFLAEANWAEYNAPNNVTYDQFQIVNYFEGSISQKNIFDALGCHIAEASDGDYIEFYATWNGAFPDSLITTLNESGPNNNWIFSHQLQVYEQIGSDQVPTGNTIIYQDSNFDQILTYRPILQDAGFAISMSIDYTMRLINTATGDQVIKTASMSIVNPNKYGKHLVKINLPDGPASMKVYNKIVQKNFETYNIFSPKSTQQKVTPLPPVQVQETEPKTVVVKEYLPLKQMDIMLGQTNALRSVGNETDSVIYSQGRLVLPIDPVDNFIRFTVYTANPTDATNQKRLDLNNGSVFKLNFGGDTSLTFQSITDNTLISPSRGEIGFRITKDLAQKVLALTDPNFFVTLVSSVDSTETLFYTGTWVSSVNYAKLLAAQPDAVTSAQNQKVISGLRTQVQNLTAESEKNTVSKLDNRAKVENQPKPTPRVINPVASKNLPESQQPAQS